MSADKWEFIGKQFQRDKAIAYIHKRCKSSNKGTKINGYGNLRPVGNLKGHLLQVFTYQGPSRETKALTAVGNDFRKRVADKRLNFIIQQFYYILAVNILLWRL